VSDELDSSADVVIVAVGEQDVVDDDIGRAEAGALCSSSLLRI
jgi:hypothetical protein